MRGCYFAGAALHTSLGSTLDSHVAKVSEGPSGSTQVTAEYAGKTQTLPYKLLADAPLRQLDERRVFAAFAESLDGVHRRITER